MTIQNFTRFISLSLLFFLTTHLQAQDQWYVWKQDIGTHHPNYSEASDYLKHKNKDFKKAIYIQSYIGLIVFALKEDSTVIVWGQIDDNNLIFPEALQGHIVDIAGNTEASYLLMDDSTVWKTEYNGIQQIDYLDNIIAIDAGGEFSGDRVIFLKADGTVYTQFGLVSGLSNIKAVAINNFYMLALEEDGSLHGWEADGYFHDDFTPEGLDSVKFITADNVHSFGAVTENNEIILWEVYPPGDGRPTPFSYGVVPNIIDFEISENAVTVLKSNHEAELIGGNFPPTVTRHAQNIQALVDRSNTTLINDKGGFQFLTQTDTHNPRLVFPNGLTRVKELVGGLSHSAALTPEGNVIIWGLANHIPKSQLDSVIAIDARHAVTMALHTNSTISVWGGFDEQQLIPDNLNGLIDIKAGYKHGLALKNNGTVIAWGSNEFGQLDIPTDLDSVIAIEAGSNHNLALKSDGTVVAWGKNDNGQSNVPVGLDNVAGVSAGNNSSYVWKNDGTIVAFHNYIPYEIQDIIDTLSNVKQLTARAGLTYLDQNGRIKHISTEYNYPSNFPENLPPMSNIAVGASQAFAWRGFSPTISSTVNEVTNQDSIPITISFSDITNGFDISDITTENCTIINLSTTDNRIFTATMIAQPNINERTPLTAIIADSVLVDDLGIPNVRSNLFTVDYWPNSNRVSGRVYEDVNGNCQYDENTDIAIKGYVIQIIPNDYYTLSKEDGSYSFLIPRGDQRVELVIPTLQGQLISADCETAYDVSLNEVAETATDLDFGLTITKCPVLSVSVSSNRRRRCFENITTITYRNEGYATATNAQVHLRLPEYVDLLSADSNYTITSDSVYVFDVGDVAPNETGRIRVQDIVRCVSGITGLDQCTEAWITPVNTCFREQTPPPVTWDGSTVTVESTCLGETIGSRFVIRNVSTFDMSETSTYRLFRDQFLASSDSFQLAGGDSLVIDYAPYYNTIRVEADQTSAHPNQNTPFATVTSCSEAVAFRVSSANFFQQADAEPEIEVDCLPIIDSFDPNDKLATPQGITVNRYVNHGARLDYRIRFQNTGTDTAYTVIVVDTLSSDMDIASLRMGSTSHDYSLELSGSVNPVLTWTFNDIDLVDSVRDEPNSHGFIKFSIAPKEGLTDGTIVDNEADIYFDFNEPIRTNNAWVNYYDTVITTNDYVFGEDLTTPIPTIEEIAEFTNAPFRITININEEVVLTLPAFSIKNATLSDLQGSGKQYSALVTPITEGEVSISLAAGSIQDAAGNQSLASNLVSLIYDITAPTVSISAIPTHSNTPYRLDIQLSDATNFDLSNINATNATLSDLQGSELNYSVLVTPMTEGQVSVVINENEIADEAGNQNVASNQAVTIYDSVVPTVAISTIPTHSNSPYRLDIQLSEVVNFTLADVNASNANLSDLQGTDLNYSVLVSPIVDGQVSVLVNEGVLTDEAGNENTVSNTAITVYDITVPVATIQSIPTFINRTYRLDIQLSEAVDLTLSAISATNANLSDLQGGSNAYSVLVSPLAEGQVTVNINENMLIDDAGNPNPSSNSAITTYDVSSPSVTISSTPSHANSPYRLDIQLSELVDFNLANINSVNANLSDLQGSELNYSVLVSPIAEGNVSISITENTLIDPAGNQNSASNSAVTIYDITSPNASISTAPDYINAPYRLDIQLNEAIDFTLSAISIVNASLSDLQGSGLNYSVLVSPIAEGEINVFVDNNALIDQAGNVNIASSTATSIYDVTTPEMILVYDENDPFEIIIRFSEDIQEVISLSDLNITGATAIELIAEGDEYRLVLNPVAGQVTVELFASVITDLAGNANVIQQKQVVTALVNQQLSAQTILAPNPTAGSMNLSLPLSLKGDKTIQLLSTTGQVVKTVHISTFTYQFELSDLQNGAYILHVISGDHIIVKSFIKQ